jgi:protein O-GlcNAc transferase
VLASYHFNLGIALQDKGQLDDATAEFRTAVALAPNGARLHNSLGEALYHEGQLDDAFGDSLRG